MKKTLLAILLTVVTLHEALPADPPPVIGLCIAAPSPDRLKQFITFMEEELAPNGVNTLVLRVDYNYEFKSYPDMRDEGALTEKEVKKLVRAAREHGIALIPQINLLGHQSWAGKIGRLLEVYPEFDENPSVKMPADYKWPNDDGLYCKSYCPLHPDLHQVVFALVDEIMDVFEASAFHAGMDEVFYIGEEECPRCSGKDRSELFSGEVNTLRDHLAANDRDLWIWGDRMLDGETTGLGMWEASKNDTYRSIDMISKDVVICDWHYERADPTAAIFALKGFRVITCPYRNPEVTKDQLEMLELFRTNSARGVKDRYYGIMQTIWSPASTFLDLYYNENPDPDRVGQVESLKSMFNFYTPAE